jgi:hypothetical protein
MAGRRSVLEKAHRDVRDRLEKFDGPPLPGAPRRELEKIMKTYAVSQDAWPLPESGF